VLNLIADEILVLKAQEHLAPVFEMLFTEDHRRHLHFVAAPAHLTPL
jgi:hypothetical protein